MPGYERGVRVGAVCNADEKTVRLYGYGVYEGDEVPPPGIQIFGQELHELGHANPKIKLDSGKVVWGCECWWGAEEKVKTMIGDRTVVEVDIEAERLAAQEKKVEDQAECPDCGTVNCQTNH